MAQLTLFNLSLTFSAISGLHDPTKLKKLVTISLKMSSILFPAVCTSKHTLSMQNVNVGLRYVGPIKCPL